MEEGSRSLAVPLSSGRSSGRPGPALALTSPAPRSFALLFLSLSLFILFSFPTHWPFPSLPDTLGISKQLLRTVLKMAWPESPRKWDERDR